MTTYTPGTDTHRILMANVNADRQSYGITSQSAFVYTTPRSYSPTRIVVWSNVNRPNPRNGGAIRWGEYGRLDGGVGQYLDPHNEATDAEVTVLVTPEASCLSAHGDSTGTVASGQVYDPTIDKIRSGDRLIMFLPDGSEMTGTVRMTNNGHGVIDLD